MRAHASWYTKGMYGSAALRERINRADTAQAFRDCIHEMMEEAAAME